MDAVLNHQITVFDALLTIAVLIILFAGWVIYRVETWHLR